MTDRRKHIARLAGLAASIALIILTIFLFTSFGFMESHQLRGVEFTVLDQNAGESLLDSADLQYPMSEIYPAGIAEINVDSISLERIEKQYMANPFVSHCRTYIDKRQILQVEIKERIPLVRIFSQNGGSYYIDREGVSMPVSVHYTPRTLVATGHLPILPLESSVDSMAVHRSLFDLAEAVMSDVFMSSFVSEIHVDSQHQFYLIPLVGDFRIRVNADNQIAEKFDNMKIFLKEGLGRLGWDKYSELVIDYDNQIIGKKIINP